MKLKEYKEKLDKLIQEYPEALDYDVITSSDDEGNMFNLVHFDPSVGYFEYGEFTPFCPDEPAEINSVCLN